MNRIAAHSLCALTAIAAAVGGAPACTTDVRLGTSPTAPMSIPLTHPQDVSKVDLLFVVDNSTSMVDKQIALSKRIPELMRLLTQVGVDPISGGAPKVVDLHVAAITSSLGSLGTSVCNETQPHGNDHAHLLPRAGEAPPTTCWSYSATGEPTATACPTLKPHAPIRWVLDPKTDPDAELQGAGALAALETAVTADVMSAGDDGCGIEMPLEAMYRFLIDPAPPLSVGAHCASPVGACDTDVVASGLDTELLAQRAAFLRPDSLVAVVLITDEGDSSSGGNAPDWVPWQVARGEMPRAAAGCASIADDVEPATDDERKALLATYACQPCSSDPTAPGCDTGWSTKAGEDRDERNLRAWAPLQRFGYDFLRPISRYVDGLTLPTIKGADGADVPNPLFAGGRSRDLVVVAGIVGAPTALVNDDKGFPRALGEDDWKRLVSSVPGERDPHMIESIAPRAGVARFSGSGFADPANGGDRDIPLANDLQYACLGAETEVAFEAISDCQDPTTTSSDPACTSDGKVHARAYPGIRPLRVIHGVGTYGYVASICDSSYRGAIAGLAAKIAAGAVGK